MDRQIFEALPMEKKVAFMNERPKMTLKQIADEIGMPSSSLGQIFSKEGYSRRAGQYVKDTVEQKAEAPVSVSGLEELLPYKDELIAMAVEHQKQETPLDFSVFGDYKDEEGKINWSTLTFQIPEELHQSLDDYLERRGYKKQMLLSLLIHQFLKK